MIGWGHGREGPKSVKIGPGTNTKWLIFGVLARLRNFSRRDFLVTIFRESSDKSALWPSDYHRFQVFGKHILTENNSF